MKLPPFDQAVPLDTVWLRGPEDCPGLDLAFSPDGRWLAGLVLDFDRLDVWSTATRQRAQVFTEDCRYHFAFSSEDDWLATATDEAASIWELASGARLARVAWDPPLRLMRLRFGPSGRDLIALAKECLCVWDVLSRTGPRVYWFEPEDQGLDFVTWDGRLFALTEYQPVQPHPYPLAPRNFYLSKIDPYSGERLFTTPIDWRPVFSSDRHWALLCTDLHRNRYEVWDIRAGQRCSTVTLPVGIGTEQPLLSTDGRYVARSCQATAAVMVWDAQTGALLNQIELGGSHYCPAVVFSPTYRLLAVVMNRPEEPADRTLFLDPLTGAVIGFGRGHPNRAFNYVFSPCGRWFASAMTEEAHRSECHPRPSGTVFLTDLNPILPLAQQWESAHAG